MTLRSGTSYWQLQDPEPIGAEPLAGDVTCEVVVIGGGVTGALVAHRLVREGVDTVLVDKRELGTGSTAASTGLLQYEVDTPLVNLIDKVGEAGAVHAYRRGLTAIDEIEQLTHELGDRCGFSRRTSLYFASHAWHCCGLRREYECRRQHGFAVELLDRKGIRKISSLPALAAIRSTGDAQIDPYRFTQRLLAGARQSGLRAYARSEVQSIDLSSAGVRLTTAAGSIVARRVVFATGYDSYRYLKSDPGTLHSTYALASEPLDSLTGWPEGGLIWETARPYFYARLTDDGRAVIGGGDTAFAEDHQRDALVERKARRLEKRFAQLFPAIEFKLACAWAGTFGESKDGLAYIGQTPARPHAYFAIGYGGNGITFSAIASKLIVDLYVGRPNADAAVFRFGR